MRDNLERAYKIAVVRGWPNLAECIRLAIPTNDVPTAATDEIDILYNPEFIDPLTAEEQVAVFMHEYYHIIYEHVTRRGRRVPMLWNLAADVIVNDAVSKRCKFKLPKAHVARGKGVFEDLPKDVNTTTKIYDWLMQNKVTQISEEEMEQALDHPSESSSSSPGSGKQFEPKEGDNKKGENKQQKEANKKAGQMAGSNDPEIKEVLQVVSDVDWIDLVKALQIESGRLVHRTHERSFRRPARYEPSGLIRPCFNRYQHHPKVDVYIDVSGSMGDNPNAIFSGLVSILGQMRIYRPRFYSFDTQIVHLPDLKSTKDICSGGGTDIHKVLNKIKEDKADLALLITDCGDNITVDDIPSNVVVVSDNQQFANYFTTDWKKVQKRRT